MQGQEWQDAVSVLIVDDTPENLLLLEALLHGLDVNVAQARSGAEALREAQTREFALILLDVRMPDMDGIQTAARIREPSPSAQMPIIFLTAYDPRRAEILKGYQGRRSRFPIQTLGVTHASTHLQTP
jgi:CheY-like chemotaxis protein